MILAYREYRKLDVEWLGEVPAHWKDSPMRHLFRRAKRTGYASETLLSVYRDYGVIEKSSRSDNFNSASDDLDGYQLVEPGDLAINKMKAWQGSVAISTIRGIVSPAYFIYRPSHHAHAKYLHYLFRSNEYISAYALFSKGVRINQWDLAPEQHSAMKVLLPPLDEQRQIADYLDRETGKIDTLIAKQDQLVETLAERRQVLRTQAVTKGFDPATKLKTSGSAWFRLIAESWALVPCGLYTELIQTGPFGSQLHAEDYVEGGTPIVNPMHIQDGRIVTTATMTVARAKAAELSRHALKLHDVVVARRGEIGRSAVVEDDSVGFLCGTGSAIVRVDKRRLDPHFFDLVFGSEAARDGLLQYSVGSTMDNLNTSTVADLRIPLPPIEEQKNIVALLREKEESISRTSAKAIQIADVLRERRQALISAAVTGKIDVRGL